MCGGAGVEEGERWAWVVVSSVGVASARARAVRGDWRTAWAGRADRQGRSKPASERQQAVCQEGETSRGERRKVKPWANVKRALGER